VPTRRSQLLFDAQKLIVFRQAIGAGERSRFDLSAIRRHRKIGDGGVFRFAGTVRHDGAIGGAVRGINRFQRFAQRADLIDLD